MMARIDTHPMRYASERSEVERILTRRLAERRLDGFTLETSLEILDALFATPPAPAQVEAASSGDRRDDVFRRLLTTAKLLYANSEGCAVNHYGDDFAIHGLPGWLTDCAADIQAAEQEMRS